VTIGKGTARRLGQNPAMAFARLLQFQDVVNLTG
jgi:hypothetical protein